MIWVRYKAEYRNWYGAVFYIFIGIHWLTTCMSFLLLLIFIAGWVSTFGDANFHSYLNWFLYVCEMIIFTYHFHWLILYLLRSVYCFFLFNYCSWYVIGCFTKSDLFVCLWNDHHLISSLFLDSLLTWIWIVFRFIWMIVVRMLVICFSRNDLITYMFAKWLFSYIQFIDWFLLA